MPHKKKYTAYEEGGVKHWAADPVDCDTHIACDLFLSEFAHEIDCVQCLQMIIFYLTLNKEKRSGIAADLL